MLKKCTSRAPVLLLPEPPNRPAAKTSHKGKEKITAKKDPFFVIIRPVVEVVTDDSSRRKFNCVDASIAAAAVVVR